MSIMRLRVSSRLFLTCIVVALFASHRGLANQEQVPQTQEQIQARDELNHGVQGFKNGQTDDAIRLFERAKQLDPSLLNARLYLATAYASQYIPGAPNEENKQIGQRAIEEFKGVLQVDPENLSAIDGIGSLLFQMGGTPPVNLDLFQESKAFQQKHSQIKPEDPEPYYWVGVIDWTAAFRANAEIRAQYNQKARGKELADDEPLPRDVRHQYAQQYGPTIAEGIQNLQKAIEMKPDYDDAMAYLNLMYRRKADVVDTQVERDDLQKMADDLLDKVKDLKQRRLAAPAQQPN